MLEHRRPVTCPVCHGVWCTPVGDLWSCENNRKNQACSIARILTDTLSGMTDENRALVFKIVRERFCTDCGRPADVNPCPGKPENVGIDGRRFHDELLCHRWVPDGNWYSCLDCRIGAGGPGGDEPYPARKP